MVSVAGTFHALPSLDGWSVPLRYDALPGGVFVSLRARALDELDALLDRSPAVQEARLAELRVQDPDLAAEVARLLQAESTADDGISRLVQRAAQDLDLPKELGLYRILREIGRGGMGVVYEAEQVRPRRRVALKTLPVLGVTPDARARFEVEVQALAQVQHPGIPQVYEVFEHDGRPIVAKAVVRSDRQTWRKKPYVPYSSLFYGPIFWDPPGQMD